jgi:hypothetical protein
MTCPRFKTSGCSTSIFSIYFSPFLLFNKTSLSLGKKNSYCLYAQYTGIHLDIRFSV